MISGKGRGGPGRPGPELGGGGAGGPSLKKPFFRPFGAQFGLD